MDMFNGSHVNTQETLIIAERRFMIIGFCLGAFGHKWYGILDRWIKEKTGRALFRKIFVDQIVASPIMNAIFIG
uniref:Uncharacterized protein n=1 Tax=Romanomermis culicivorax TaxID=13658 RepID=A0A915K562_ROMCU